MEWEAERERVALNEFPKLLQIPAEHCCGVELAGVEVALGAVQVFN